MASFASLTAPVKWAQRKESVLVTISLADVKDYTVVFDDNKFTFSGTSGIIITNIIIIIIPLYINYVLFHRK